MIRAPRAAENLVTTSEAHVRIVAAKIGGEPLVAGPWLYCVRKLPLLGQPIIYRCRVEVAA
jgi:hypothetical protein